MAGNDETMREIRSLVKNALRRSGVITHFEPYEHGYYAIPEQGERLDIIRVQNFQPPIENTDDYYGYMFVQTQFSFFIMRQRVFENRVHDWELYMELEPHEPAYFFKRVCARAEQLLEMISEPESEHEDTAPIEDTDS